MIKLCNPVSKVPVCMADQAKLLVAASQCESSVNYMQLKTEAKSMRNVEQRAREGSLPLPGTGWLLQAPGWPTPRSMMQSGCNLRCCLEERRGDGTEVFIRVHA